MTKMDFAALNKLLQKPLFACKDMKTCNAEYAISVIANKSICHYNNFHREDRANYELIQMLREQLISADSGVNIDYIMKEIKNMFKNGVELRGVNYAV